MFQNHLYSNMVLLTVVTNSNPHTLYFDHPIEKPNYIRLLSASLYNSWYNLKKNGAISTLPEGDGKSSVIPFEPGHYTVDGLVEEFAYIKQNKPRMDITARAHKAIGLMIIHNLKNIRFSANLAELFGINPALKPITIIKQLNSPITYFVHCNLIDKRQNLLNGKPSTVLAKEFAYIKQNKPRMDITARAHKAIGLMIIHNLKNIRFSANLAELFGINPALKPITIIKQLNSPITYFVHCNLIDKRQNLLNGKPSTVLAKFDIRGQPFERVHFQTPQQHVLRDTESGDYDVNSITLSVKDENGNLFAFNDYPLEFEVEIN